MAEPALSGWAWLSESEFSKLNPYGSGTGNERVKTKIIDNQVTNERTWYYSFYAFKSRWNNDFFKKLIFLLRSFTFVHTTPMFDHKLGKKDICQEDIQNLNLLDLYEMTKVDEDFIPQIRKFVPNWEYKVFTLLISVNGLLNYFIFDSQKLTMFLL